MKAEKTGSGSIGAKTLLPLLLIISLFLTGFSRSVASASSPEPRYARDYEILWDALESSYPYLPYLRDSRHIDVDGVRARYLEELASVEDEASFEDLIRRMLGELGNFAHLDLVPPSLYQSYYFIFVQQEGLVSAELAAPFIRVLTDPGLSERYRRSESGDLPPEETAEASYPTVAVMYYADCKALHLHISSFAQETVERDRDLVKEALSKYPQTEHIIFDLTGNSGGSDYYWMQNLVEPFGGSYAFSYRNYFKSSALLDTYYASLESSPSAELEDAPSWVADLGLDRYFETEMILPEGENAGEEAFPEIKRWVLTSGQVYSASEKFVCFCKATGWATLVGTRTAGDGLGSTPILILLPESGLLIRFSSMVGENPDGKINAVTGTMPDLLCRKGMLPLTLCLKTIRNKG